MAVKPRKNKRPRHNRIQNSRQRKHRGFDLPRSLPRIALPHQSQPPRRGLAIQIGSPRNKFINRRERLRGATETKPRSLRVTEDYSRKQTRRNASDKLFRQTNTPLHRMLDKTSGEDDAFRLHGGGGWPDQSRICRDQFSRKAA